MKTFKIDTGETDSYGIDWAVRLPAGDAIAESEWTADDESLDVEDGSFSGTRTAFIVTAPDTAGTFVLRNVITTTGELELQASVRLKVSDDD